MDLKASQFMEPAGELREDMFPGTENVESSHVNTWLSQAEEEVATSEEDLSDAEKRQAKKAYVYYRAYHAVWLRLTTTPREADVEEDGSLRYSDAQVARFKELSDQHEATFERLTEVDPDETEETPTRSQSVSSTTRLL